MCFIASSGFLSLHPIGHLLFDLFCFDSSQKQFLERGLVGWGKSEQKSKWPLSFFFTPAFPIFCIIQPVDLWTLSVKGVAWLICLKLC